MWNWAVEKGYAPPWLWKAGPVCLLLAVTFSLPSLLGQGYRPFMTVASVQGVLKHVEIEKCNSYKGETTWTPRVSYEYTLAAWTYSGTRFAIERSCTSRAAAEHATRQLVPGGPVTVFYNADRPRFAMLEKPRSLVWTYLGQAFMGLVGITVLWNHYRIRRGG